MVPRGILGPLVLVLVACSPVPPPPASAPPSPPLAPTPKRPELLLPPLGPTPNASWLDTSGPDDDVEAPDSPDAYGMNAAISKTYAIHEDLGVVGPLALPPGRTYVGLDGDDAIWVGAPNGFFFAAGVRAARTAFVKALAPSAGPLTAFTATKGLVAATDGKALFVKRSGSKTFDRKTYSTIRSIQDIAARPDGTIAIVGRDAKNYLGIWLTRGGDSPAPTLEESSFAEGEPKLESHGTALQVAGCPAVTLAADGTRWLMADDDLAHDELATAWLEPFARSEYPVGFASKRRTLIAPGAPTKGTVTKTTFPCGSQGIGHRAFGARRGTVLRDCSFAECLAGTNGPAPKQTGIRAAFYSDGSCAEGAPDSCRIWKRPPQIWHSRVPEPIAIPKGCQPQRLFTAGGIGVLLCKSESKVSVHTLDKAGAFHPEGEVAFDYAHDIRIADDGTLMLTKSCSTAPCPPVAVRAPRPLGDPTAWRVVAPLPGGAATFAYRVLRGGNALVITGAGPKMSLWIDRPGEPPVPFVRDLDVPSAVLDLDVERDRIVVSTVKRSTWLLTDQGLTSP